MSITHDTGPAYLDGQPVVSVNVEVDTEYVDVSTAVEPDPDWTFTDAAGHFHAYTKDGKLPTLILAKVVAPPDEGLGSFDDDGDWEWDDDPVINYKLEHQCRICNEPVQPGTRTPAGPTMKPGRKSWTATVVTPTRPANPMVSVWHEGARGWFGVGAITSTVHDGQMWTLTVTGNGELGQR